MGLLTDKNAKRIVLLDEHLLGRSSKCDSQLSELDTSSRHALVSWEHSGWWLRDLGSTNGTRLNDARLLAGEVRQLSLGDTVRFGATEAVTVSSVDKPLPVLLGLADQTVISGSSSLIVLPEDSAPGAALVLEKGAQWWLEGCEENRSVHDGEVLTIGGESYQFFACRGRVRTVVAAPSELSLEQAVLHFSVSLDEEHVSLRVTCEGQDIDLGSRTHHYTTLQLARVRETDAATEELPATSHGWVDSRDLLRMLDSNATRLSVEICRIRQQFAQLGFVDAADIVERRRGTGQLRLGTGSFAITCG